MSAFRCGIIGIAGRPSTGKSSLLNRLVGEKLSIVSPRAQTTRHLLRGILTTADAQYVFIDAPGLPPRRRSLLHRTLGRRATEATHESDLIMLVVEAGHWLKGDADVLSRMAAGRPVVAVANKVDQVSHSDLLPIVERLARQHDFHAIVPVSAKTGKNLGRLLEVLRDALPPGDAIYPHDQMTDRDERFLAAERVREKLFLALADELPYRCEVLIDRFQRERRLRRIEATVFVERDSQKAIVIGRGGTMLKRIGAAARRELEDLFAGPVHLTLWVKVREGWTNDPRFLGQLGHG